MGFLRFICSTPNCFRPFDIRLANGLKRSLFHYILSLN